MAYWYIAKEDELLLDMDDYEKRIQRYQIWGEMFRQRFRDALNAELVEVRMTNGKADIIIAESNSTNHFHVFIRLAKPMSLLGRMIWQMRLGSDWKRSQSDLMRVERGIAPASLLIRTNKVEGLWREPDCECPCPSGKHVTLVQVELLKSGKGCSVWELLRGATPWELFGKPAHQTVEMPVNLPVGHVPLELILKVGKLKEE